MRQEEIFESFCANFYPYLSVSCCCSSVHLSLREYTRMHREIECARPNFWGVEKLNKCLAFQSFSQTKRSNDRRRPTDVSVVEVSVSYKPSRWARRNAGTWHMHHRAVNMVTRWERTNRQWTLAVRCSQAEAATKSTKVNTRAKREWIICARTEQQKV